MNIDNIECLIKDSTLADTDVDVCAYRDEKPVQAVVNFSSMNKGKFERWSWFWQNRLAEPTLYLFLRDDEHHYYIGTDQNPLLSKRVAVITKLLDSYSIPPHRSVAVGSSMGGYAAILFAHLLNMKAAISINPQVDKNSAKLHDYTLWIRKMNEVGSGWKDLNEVINYSTSYPDIYLLNGLHNADLVAADVLSKVVESRPQRLFREQVKDVEHGWVGMSSDRLRNELNRILEPNSV